MVKEWLKIVNKANSKKTILIVIWKILDWNLQWLDIKPLSWKDKYYRCRIWKFRIIYFEKKWKYYIDKVWYRWDIYK